MLDLSESAANKVRGPKGGLSAAQIRKPGAQLILADPHMALGQITTATGIAWQGRSAEARQQEPGDVRLQLNVRRWLPQRPEDMSGQVTPTQSP